MAVAAAIILFWPSAPDPTPETLMKTDLAELPLRIEEWLERQRAALPAPAARLVDGIALKLEALPPQLQTPEPLEPPAAEIRKLIREELRARVNGYRRVPPSLRRDGRNGIQVGRAHD